VKHGEERLQRTDAPAAPDEPPARRVHRAAIGSLAGEVDQWDDWDSPCTNAQIAADFGIGERPEADRPTV
jgi:hypothetical protein